MKKLIETFEVHEQLNPKLWNGSELKPEVRQRILDIVEEFKNNCWIPLKVLDVHLVGSNASFNYTQYSDLDVHIITRFDEYDSSQEIIDAYYNAEKSSFNKNYDITLHGVPVELYVEDVESSAISNGIFSIGQNKWIKYPEPIEVKEHDISSALAKWKEVINSVLSNNDYNQMNKIVDNLYIIRKNSIAADGEYGAGNQLFKEIRNIGLLDELKDRQKEGKAKQLTLEQLEYYVDTKSISDLMKEDI